MIKQIKNKKNLNDLEIFYKKAEFTYLEIKKIIFKR